MRVVNPYDPAFREAKSALGGAAVLANAEEFSSIADAVADCSLVVGTTAGTGRTPQHEVRRLEEGAELILKRLAGNSRRGKTQAVSGKNAKRANCVALLFGSEKRGLSNEDLSHCHWLMRIPTREESLSMNLGQAVAVCLYELARDAKAATKAEKVEMAAAEVIERMTGFLLEALDASGYLGIRKVNDVEERMRRLVRRLNLPARDADLWLGIYRQIVWKLKRDGKTKGE
jgi:tRNA/rRNA methyltransferase